MYVNVTPQSLRHRIDTKWRTKMKIDGRIGTIRTIVIPICPFCEERILKCDYCGHFFETAFEGTGEKVECQNGMRHICEKCMD